LSILINPQSAHMFKKWYCLILSVLVLSLGYSQEIPTLSVSAETIQSEKQIKLNTLWAETDATGKSMGTVTFPHVWPDDQAQGYKCYQLILLTDYTKPLTLEIPDMYTCYRLWVNNKVIAQSGLVGKDASSSKPEWIPKIATLPKANQYHFKLEISNFLHSKGGVKNPILLGQQDFLEKKRANAETAAILLIALLALFGVGITIYFWWTSMPVSALYFSLLCFAWALRVSFSELYIVPYYFPSISWHVVIHIEYLSLFAAIGLGVKFVSSLYPLDRHKIMDILILSLLGLFSLLVIFFKPIVFTLWLNVYLTVTAVALGYMAFTVAKAVGYARYGALYSVFAILVGLAAFTYNLMSYQGLFEFNPLVYNINYLVIFTLVAIAMFYQRSKRADYRNAPDMLTFDHYYKNDKKA
jgi:hypothetical protein